MPVTLADVETAARRIGPYAHRTPVVTSATVDAELGAEVFFKCENLQKVGAFKVRGALNVVLGLPDAEAEAGVVTHSSGNHGAALAYAAGVRGIPCTVAMPEDAPAVKVEAVQGYGAHVVFCRQEERAATAERLRAETGATLVPPFDDERIVAGQGTAGLELLDEVPDLDVLVTPVGGGGLLAGAGVVLRARRPGGRLIGAEPEAVDDAYRSMQTGVRQPEVVGAKTLADGLRTNLGLVTFPLLYDLGAEIVLMSEDDIVAAAEFFLYRMKLVVEPSAATVLAALRNAVGLAGCRIGAIVSGGNTDFAWLRR